MDNAAQEYLEFIVKLKGQEMEKGIDLMMSKLVDFDQRAKKQLDNVSAALDKIATRGKALHTSLTASLNGVEKLFEQLNSQMAQDKNAAEFMKMIVELGQATRYTATGVDKMAKSLKEAGEAAPPDFDKLAKQAKKASEETKNVGDETKKATKEVKQGLAEQARSAEKNAQAGEKMGSSWKASLKDMQKGVAEATAAAGVAFAGLSAAGGLSLKVFGDLQANANTLMAVSGANSAQLEEMTDKANAFAKSGDAMALGVERAEVELARLGFTGAEVVESIDAIVYASQAAGEDLGQTGETVAGLVRGFGLQAKDAAFVADVLAESANKSALSLNSVQLSMKYIAPIASASNQSLTAMTSVLMELSNNMILGEQAGTSVRAMLDSLNNATPEAGRLMKHLGLVTQDAEGKLRPLADIFADLKVKMADYSDTAKSKMLSDIFGREASSAASVLLKANTEALKENESSLDNSAGASQRTAEIMRQGLNAELDKLKNKSMAAAVEIGGKLAPAVEGAVKFLSSMLDIVSELPEPVKDTAVQVGGLAIAFAGLSFAMGGAITAGGKLLGVLGQLGQIGSKLPWLAGAGAMLAGPVGWIGAAATLTTMYGVNAANNNADEQVQANEQQNKENSDKSSSLSKLNAVLNKAGEGKDLKKLDKSDLANALKYIQELKVSTDKYIKAERDLGDLQDKLRNARKMGVSGIELSSLEKEVEQKRLYVEQNSSIIERAHSNMERYIGLETKFQAELKKRPEDKKGGQAAPDESAERDANKKKLDAATDFLDKLTRERGTYEKSLETQAQNQLKRDSQVTASDNTRSKQLVKNAEEVAAALNTKGRCLTGVNIALEKYLGKRQIFGIPAYGAADQLAKNKQFEEMQWDQKSQLPAGAVTVWSKGASKYGHISIADGAGNELSDHKQKQITSRKGATARVFMLKGESGAATGQTKEQKEEIAKQAIMNQMIERYNVDLAKMIAYRNQLPAQSEAWKKVDGEVFKLQQDAQQAGINLTKSKMELDEKFAQAAREWASEQLDMESEMLTAKAALTKTTLDDIEAMYKSNLNNIAKEELNRLAKDGTTEEQRLQLKKLYNTKRLVAEKQYKDQVNEYTKENENAVTQLLFEGEQTEIDRMADGAEKRIKLSKLAEAQKIEAVKQSQEKLRELNKEGTNEYALLELKKTEIARRAAEDRTEIERAEQSRQRREAIQDSRQQVERDISNGALTPDQALAARLASNKDLIKQANEDIAAATEKAKLADQEAEKTEIVRNLRKEITGLEQHSMDLIIGKMKQEQDLRQRTMHDTVRSLDTLVNGFERVAGLNLGIGKEMTNWVSLLDQAASMFSVIEKVEYKDSDGKDASKDVKRQVGLSDILSKGLGAFAGAALGPTGVSAVVSVASALQQTLAGAAEAVKDIWFPDPTELAVQALNHKNRLLQIDMDIQRSRIEQAKSIGQDTFALERQQILDRAKLDEQALDAEKMVFVKKVMAKPMMFRSDEDRREVMRFEAEDAAKRVNIGEQTQNALYELEKQRIEKVRALEDARYNSLMNAADNAAITQAGLTPGKKDDIEAEKNRALRAAGDVWRGRMKDMEGKNDPNLKRAADAELSASSKKAYAVSGQSELDEASRIRQMQDKFQEERIQSTQKGLQQEISLIKHKTSQEQGLIKDQLDDYRTGTEEREILSKRLQELPAKETKSIADATEKAADALANNKLNLAAEIAKGTKTQTDDIIAQYKQTLQGLTIAEREARKNLVGEALTTELARIAQARINGAKDVQKQLKQIWATEYREKLDIQREFIQDSLDADRKEWDDKIKTTEKSLKAIRDTIEKHERTLEKSRKDREQDQKEFDPEDAVQSKKFNSDLAGFDADALAWKGVDEISNVIRRDGLANVSGETARKGLLEEAELQEMEAQNLWRQEKITQQEYINRMQKAQLMRAKAAEMELDTEELTTRRKLELQGEWADAYVKWQELARQSIDARYDAADQRTRDNIELERQNEQQQQQTLDSYQAKITALQEVADEKLKLIDAEIKNVDRSTRDAASAWTDVQSGIAGTRAEMDKLLAQYERMPANLGAGALGFSSGGSSGAGQPTGSVANLGKNYASGTDGKQYTTTSDMIAAERGVKAASGGFTPFNSQYQGDKYGPIFAQPGEALIPFERWPEILRPFMPPSGGGGGNNTTFATEVKISGNHIVGEFDMHDVAYGAVNQAFKEMRDRHGFLYNN